LISLKSMAIRPKGPVDGKPVLVRVSQADRAAIEEVARAESRDMGELLRLYALPRIREEAERLRRPEPPPKPKTGKERFALAPRQKALAAPLQVLRADETFRPLLHEEAPQTCGGRVAVPCGEPRKATETGGMETGLHSGANDSESRT